MTEGRAEADREYVAWLGETLRVWAEGEAPAPSPLLDSTWARSPEQQSWVRSPLLRVPWAADRPRS